MLFLVEQAFVGRDQIRAPLNMPLCEARRKDECKGCKPTVQLRDKWPTDMQNTRMFSALTQNC